MTVDAKRRNSIAWNEHYQTKSCTQIENELIYRAEAKYFPILFIRRSHLSRLLPNNVTSINENAEEEARGNAKSITIIFLIGLNK